MTSKTRSVRYTSTYVPREESWLGKAGRPWNPGLVIYAHADGGFSVWDPARNYWKKQGNLDVQERLCRAATDLDRRSRKWSSNKPAPPT